MIALDTDQLIKLMEGIVPPKLMGGRIKHLVSIHRAYAREMARELGVEYVESVIKDGKLVSVMAPLFAGQEIPAELRKFDQKAAEEWTSSQPTPVAVRA